MNISNESKEKNHGSVRLGTSTYKKLHHKQHYIDEGFVRLYSEMIKITGFFSGGPTRRGENITNHEVSSNRGKNHESKQHEIKRIDFYTGMLYCLAIPI